MKNNNSLFSILMANHNNEKDIKKAIESVLKQSNPNAVGYRNIYRLLTQEEPWCWFPHFREYPKSWVCNLVKEHKFEIIKSETLDVWSHGKSDVEIAKKIVQNNNFSEKNRGEHTFILARK